VTDESSIRRREFLARAAAFGVAGASLVAPSAAPAADRPQSGAADFAPFVGTTFRVRIPRWKLVDLTLIAVSPPRVAPGKLPKGMRQPFSLIFRGPVGTMPQGTYTVEQARFGTFPLFLVPVDRPNLGHYEAAFG
jgi:hypothetical protein